MYEPRGNSKGLFCFPIQVPPGVLAPLFGKNCNKPKTHRIFSKGEPSQIDKV